MLKIFRNVVGRTVQKIKNGRMKVQLSDNKGAISFRHIMNLALLQNEEELIAANEVTKRHIQYLESIMDGKPATQTLSDSTVAALMYLENRNSLFKEAGNMIKYCEMINNAFTILNVRSKF